MAAAGAAYLFRWPAQEIEQVYYLGVLDPRQQLPQAVYRITVRGQGSAISFVRFASGWVPANLIDTLNTHIQFEDKGAGLEIGGKGFEEGQGLKTGRGLVLFGPEGFREAPRDHRLVIVMGQDPEAFFDAVGSGLATIAQVKQEALESASGSLLMDELIRVRAERERLQDLTTDLVAGDVG